MCLDERKRPSGRVRPAPARSPPFRMFVTAKLTRMTLVKGRHALPIRRLHLARPQGASQPIRSFCICSDPGRLHRDHPCFARVDPAADGARIDGRFARLYAVAVLCLAHDVAHVRRHRRLAGLHFRLRDACRQKPARRARPHSIARRPAIGTDPRLSVFHGDLFSWAFSGLDLGRRMRGDLRDFHLAGLEHGLFLLPVAPRRPPRPDRGCAWFRAFVVAAVLATRNALRDARANLEHDDVDVGRLVFRRRIRSDFGWRHHRQIARHRLLSRPRHRGKAHRCGVRGGRRHAGRDPCL